MSNVKRATDPWEETPYSLFFPTERDIEEEEIRRRARIEEDRIRFQEHLMAARQFYSTDNLNQYVVTNIDASNSTSVTAWDGSPIPSTIPESATISSSPEYISLGESADQPDDEVDIEPIMDDSEPIELTDEVQPVSEKPYGKKIGVINVNNGKAVYGSTNRKEKERDTRKEEQAPISEFKRVSRAGARTYSVPPSLKAHMDKALESLKPKSKREDQPEDPRLAPRPAIDEPNVVPKITREVLGNYFLYSHIDQFIEDIKKSVTPPEPVNPIESEEVIINFNELADTLATNAIKAEFKDPNCENAINKYIQLVEEYKVTILKHKRKTYDE